MSQGINLKRLTELKASSPSVTTVYVKSPRGKAGFERRMKALRKLVKEHAEELAHFEANAAKISAYLESYPHTSGGLYIVCAAEQGVFDSYTLDFIEERLPLNDGVWFGHNAYIRPIAEIQDEYEHYVVVIATNHSARVDVVTAGKHETDTTLLGQIKNHVKKGGWSQQRYARRREKQLTEYASEIAEAIERLERRESFSRIIMLGSKEILPLLKEKLPRRLRNKIKAIDVVASRQTDVELHAHAAELVQHAERAEELELWEDIRNEYMQQGRAAMGSVDVNVALHQGRVHALLIQRDTRIEGTRCKACQHLSLGVSELCLMCGEREPFAVDMVNEFVELAAKSGAKLEFADPHDELASFDGVAALLRY